MNTTFTYSILQYKHSLLLGESVNVGILFYFPEKGYIEFIPGNLHRAKLIYSNFSLTTFNSLIKGIGKKLKLVTHEGIVAPDKLKKGLNEFINQYLLNEDESGLQFTNAASVIDTYNNIAKTTEKFSQLLLPGFTPKKTELAKLQ